MQNHTDKKLMNLIINACLNKLDEVHTRSSRRLFNMEGLTLLDYIIFCLRKLQKI